ncbi:putative holin-like toxin [Bacillus cabrialesii]
MSTFQALTLMFTFGMFILTLLRFLMDYLKDIKDLSKK